MNDVQFETQESVSSEEKKETILRLFEAGLLTGEDGTLTTENKNRILDAFGFGGFENARDISALHIAKASEENLDMRTGEVDVDSYDDHGMHITEHTRFLLSEEFKRIKDKAGVKERFVQHIKKHEEMK